MPPACFTFRAATTHALLGALAWSLLGCNFSKFAASQASGMLAEAEPAFEEHWDYDFVGQAMPANLLTLEGLLRIRPDDERILLSLVKGYVGYAYGWVEDAWEQAEASGDLERAEQLQKRARDLYLHARNFGLHLMKVRESDFTIERTRVHDDFRKWLKKNYDDTDDVPALLWTGYAWGSAINVTRDDPALIADLPTVRALVERAVELDPDYFYAAGPIMLAAIDGSFPEPLGGNPKRSRVQFEDALKRTGHRFLQVQVQYARTYAVATQSRRLFESLLKYVIEAEDPLPSARLANVIAKRRAARYLAQVDSLIPQPQSSLIDTRRVVQLRRKVRASREARRR